MKTAHMNDEMTLIGCRWKSCRSGPGSATRSGGNFHRSVVIIVQVSRPNHFSPSSMANEGPQSKYWFVTVTNLEGAPDPAWPVQADGRRRRPAHLRNEALYRMWRVQARALARMEACALTAELGAGAEDPQSGLLHLHLCIKLKTKARSQVLRGMLGLEPYQYHSEVLPTKHALKMRIRYLSFHPSPFPEFPMFLSEYITPTE